MDSWSWVPTLDLHVHPQHQTRFDCQFVSLVFVTPSLPDEHSGLCLPACGGLLRSVGLQLPREESKANWTNGNQGRTAGGATFWSSRLVESQKDFQETRQVQGAAQEKRLGVEPVLRPGGVPGYGPAVRGKG